ncbi:putative small auxin-up RNA [Helianthus debilis subsp. tardiflorus]
MAIRMPRIIQARQILKRSLSNCGSTPASMDIPKGYFAICVGEQEKKRFVVPVSILSELRFQQLLHQSEQEFGYKHPMGGITIPCSEDIFTDLASRFGAF